MIFRTDSISDSHANWMQMKLRESKFDATRF